jgi:hypothetical protein
MKTKTLSLELLQTTLLPPLTVWIVQWWTGHSATKGAL